MRLWVFCGKIDIYCSAQFLAGTFNSFPQYPHIVTVNPKTFQQTRIKKDQVFTEHPDQHLEDFTREDLPTIELFLLQWNNFKECKEGSDYFGH